MTAFLVSRCATLCPSKSCKHFEGPLSERWPPNRCTLVYMVHAALLMTLHETMTYLWLARNEGMHPESNYSRFHFLFHS